MDLSDQSATAGTIGQCVTIEESALLAGQVQRTVNDYVE